MFATFFHELRAAKLPVTLKEYLTLLEAVEAGIAGGRVEDFYYLSRSAYRPRYVADKNKSPDLHIQHSIIKLRITLCPAQHWLFSCCVYPTLSGLRDKKHSFLSIPLSRILHSSSQHLQIQDVQLVHL